MGLYVFFVVQTFKLLVMWDVMKLNEISATERHFFTRRASKAEMDPKRMYRTDSLFQVLLCEWHFSSQYNQNVAWQWFPFLRQKNPLAKLNMRQVACLIAYKFIYGMLTHLPLVLHICVGELGQHWFRLWLVAWTAPSHYLNQCLHIVN